MTRKESTEVQLEKSYRHLDHSEILVRNLLDLEVDLVVLSLELTKLAGLSTRTKDTIRTRRLCLQEQELLD